MLIKDGKLNIEEFKETYSKLKWLKVPRVLSRRHKEYFYVGTYGDDEKIIKVTIRPSMRMQITESFKGYNKMGKRLEQGSKDKSVTFGSTVEVLIDNSVLEKVQKLAKTPEPIHKEVVKL